MVDEIVGRDDDLATIRGARRRGAPGIIVVAPPGMGRTSVFTSVVAELRDRRVDVLLLRPTSSARSLRFAGLSSLLPNDIAGPLTFDAVAAALDARIVAAAGPFVLAVDDLHLLDEPSLQVLADVIGRTDVFVLATIDDHSLGQDPVDRGRWTQMLGILLLGPLDVSAVVELVARHRGAADLTGPGFSIDGEAWWARCGGNPTALLSALDEQLSSLTTGRGVSADASETLPESLREQPPTIDLRHLEMSAAAHKLLAVIAVAEPMPIEIAASVAGDETLEGLITSGTVSVTEDESSYLNVRLRHPGLATQVRQSLGPLEARGVRRTALLAMRGGWSELSSTGRLRLAALAIDAGVALQDDEIAEVARLAPVAGDARLALRLTRDAAQRLDRFEDHRRLADVAHEQGQVLDLEMAIEDMRTRAASASELAALAVAESQHLLWRGGDVERALAALLRPEISGNPEIAAVRARLLATVGRTSDAIAAATQLVDHPLPRVRTQAALGLAHALRLEGRATAAVRVLDDAIIAAGTDHDPVLSVSRQVLSVAQGLALVEAGEWSQAAARANQVVAYAQRYDEAPGRAIALLVYGVASVESGSPADATGALSAALALFEALRQPAGVRWALSARALAYGLSGDPITSRNDLDRLHRLPPHPADLLPSLEARAKAWSFVAAAEPEAARRVLLEAIERFRTIGYTGAAWQCAHDLISLGRPGAITELDPVGDEPISALRQRQARAHHLHDVDALQLLIEDFEAVGGHRWAAESAAMLAGTAARNGQRQLERRTGERLAQLTSMCHGLDIPSLSAGAGNLLSAREREIALLAARGLTSRAIGDRLGLSMRTVDNHLSRCFDKLGTRNRHELADLLGSS